MSKQGKGARARSKEKRKSNKAGRKAAMKAQYQAWAAAGQNKKSKRSRKGGKKITRNRNHEVAYCGNLGCSKCHPEFADPTKAKKGTVLFGKQWQK